jgi:hypothetical protein
MKLKTTEQEKQSLQCIATIIADHAIKKPSKLQPVAVMSYHFATPNRMKIMSDSVAKHIFGKYVQNHRVNKEGSELFQYLVSQDSSLQSVIPTVFTNTKGTQADIQILGEQIMSMMIVKVSPEKMDASIEKLIKKYKMPPGYCRKNEENHRGEIVFNIVQMCIDTIICESMLDSQRTSGCICITNDMLDYGQLIDMNLRPYILEKNRKIYKKSGIDLSKIDTISYM